MTLKRRIALYMVGILIGGGLAYMFYGERLTGADWLPDERVKKRLSATLIKSSPKARSQLQAWPAELSDLRQVMHEASIDLKGSRRTPDSIYYSVQAEVKGRQAQMVIVVLRDLDRDTTATLWDLQER